MLFSLLPTLLMPPPVLQNASHSPKNCVFSFPFLLHPQEAFSLPRFSNRNPKGLQNILFCSLKKIGLPMKSPSPVPASLLAASHRGTGRAEGGLHAGRALQSCN